MKRILLLTTVFIMMLGTNFSSAQTDADNFYKSDLVSVEKVSFSNQYKMKVFDVPVDNIYSTPVLLND